MCGRYVLSSSPSELAAQFSVGQMRLDLGASGGNYNVTPRTSVPVVTLREGERVLELARWGLIPPWAKDAKIGDRMINARAETVAEKPAYRRAFRSRRSIMPADGFYEWQRVGTKKQPWFIHDPSGHPLAFAGLYETWQPEDGPSIMSCALITTAPNAVMRPLHDRMPVLLEERSWAQWLDPDTEPDLLQDLLVPAADDALEAWPVGLQVNRPSSNDPSLLTPITLA